MSNTPVVVEAVLITDDDYFNIKKEKNEPSSASPSKENSNVTYDDPMMDQFINGSKISEATRRGSIQQDNAFKKRNVQKSNKKNTVHLPSRTDVGSISEESKEWPLGLRNVVCNSFKREPNEIRGKQFVQRYDFTPGLQHILYKSCQKIPIRFFIVDDSGSMSNNDGHRVVGEGSNKKMITCTRWAELVQSLIFHAEISEAFQSPSQFRLLNGADPVMVGLGDDNGDGLVFFKEVLEESPGGQTPLCEHIRAVVKSIQQVEHELRANNQKAAVIIATDGEATDGDVKEAMRPLELLPVWVVIRLCTNEDKVVDYWNEIDKELELEMDVLDDLYNDAKEVVQINPWLVYSEPLHRIREFGASVKELDLIDERMLNSEQMRAFISFILFDGIPKNVPHPDLDWVTFITAVNDRQKKLSKVFSPLTGKYETLIDVNSLVDNFAGPNHKSKSCTIS